MSSQRSKRRALSSFAAMLAVGIMVSACAAAAPAGSGRDAGSADAGSADDVVGTWGDTAPATPHLVLSSDGTVTGSDGCNAISTTFAVDGTSITFEPFIATLMACPGVDGWLAAVRSAAVDGDEMVVSNAAGERIGTLNRAAD